MPRYKVLATVSVDVEIELTAQSQSDAERQFNDHICMSASLVDYEGSDYDVCEESISDIGRVTARAIKTE
jgi:hypothetical protein